MKKIKLLILFLLSFSLGNSGIISPLNYKEIKVPSSAYKFIVSGHWHGSSSNQSGFPAASVLANIDVMNASGALFVAHTGDLFLDASRDYPNYRKALFGKLKIPLFNAPGNHDFSDGKMHNEWGSPYSYFSLGTECFIFLDTESDNGSLGEAQLSFFKRVCGLIANENVKNVFIFSHRPIWAEEDEELKTLFSDNTRSTFSTNYKKDIEPIIVALAKTKSVYWTSGSMGGKAPVSFFYHKHKNGITFMQSAIRDLPRDAMLIVNVNQGKVSFQTVSFNNHPAPKLESCNVELWKKGISPGFNYRLIPLYFYSMLMHRYFWYGILYALFGFFIIRFILKRKLKLSGKKV